MKAEHPTLPTTEVLAIERSEHKAEIFGLLCSGVSPGRTATLILQRHGESLAVNEVTAFAEQIPDEYFLDPGKLQKRVKFIDVEIDTIGELAAILRYLKEEVEVVLFARSVSSGEGTVSEDARKLMNQYWRKLIKYAELRGELGLETATEQAAPAPVESQLPSLRDLMIQQNIILPPGTVIVDIDTKTEFVDTEVKVLDGAEAEGS